MCTPYCLQWFSASRKKYAKMEKGRDNCIEHPEDSPVLHSRFSLSPIGKGPGNLWMKGKKEQWERRSTECCHPGDGRNSPCNTFPINHYTLQSSWLENTRTASSWKTTNPVKSWVVQMRNLCRPKSDWENQRRHVAHLKWLGIYLQEISHWINALLFPCDISHKIHLCLLHGSKI